MKRFSFRRPLDVSRTAARRSALNFEVLEQRDVPSGNPPVGSIPRQVILEDAGPTAINLSSFFTDPEADSLSFAIVSETNTSGFVTNSFDVNNQILTVTPATNAYGYSYYRMTVSDGTSTVNTTMELIVREKDDLTDDTASVGSGNISVINVLGNDGSVDGTRLAEAGNMNVVQNDTGNATTSVTVTFPQGTPDMKVATGSNRGDFNVQIGTSAADDVANGLYFATVANNGRDNGEGTGAHIANANIDGTATPFIPVNRGGDGAEWNANLGVAYFSYSQGWMAGWIVNSTGANGGANDTIRSASPNGGFDVGSAEGNVIRDLFAATGGAAAPGKIRVTIPGISSQTDGILLAIHGKNEDNFALCQPEAGGSWLLTVRDNGTTGTSPTAGNEQDPVAFVYIPRNMPNVVSGRILGNGTVEMSSGVYSVTKTGTGTYSLAIPGQTPLTGTLILSPEGGTSTNTDNMVTYEPSGSNWIIQSRDITGSAITNIPALEDVGATTRMASFAFIPFLNTTTPRITSVQSASALGATVTINGDGTLNYNPLTSAPIQGLAPLASTTDTFTYTTTNLTGTTSTATVTVTVTAPSVWYVDDAWASLNPGDPIADANPIATGNQNATFGTDAFASLSAAIALASPGRKILVNAGNYASENVVIDKEVEITFQQGASTFNSISDTVSNASLIIQAGVTLTFGSAADATISSPISGNGGILKQGTGTLTLGGANTYTGTTTVAAGNLSASAANAFSPSSTIDLAASTELRLNGFSQATGSLSGSGNVTNSTANNITFTLNNNTNANFAGSILQQSTGTISLVKQGTADQQLDGTNALAAVTVNSGSLRVGSAGALGTAPAVTVNGGTLLLNGFNYTFANLAGTGGTVTNGSATNIALTLGDANNATFAGVLSNGSTGSLRIVKTGTGTFSATGTNTLTGGFTVSHGTLQTNNSNGWGTGSVTLGDTSTGSNNVAALLTSNGVTIANSIIVSASGTGTATFGTAAGITGAVNTQINGSLTLNRDVILQAGSADRTTFAGLITGTGNITTSSPGGASRITFNRGASVPANNFVGNITIGDNSVLQLGVNTLFANGNIPDAASIIFTSATSELRLTTAATSPDIEGVNALISAVPGAGLITRPNGNGILNLAIGSGNGSGNYSGIIANTAGTLNILKVGSGTQTLAGENTYNGTTTVSSGTLLAGNTVGSAFGTGAVIVDGPATLGGTGSFTGALTLNGTLAPGGAGTTGPLTTGPVTFGSGSTLAIDVANAGATFDLATLAEGSTLSGTTLKLYAGNGLTVGQQFLVLDNLGSAVLGNFANGSTIQAINNPLVTFTVSTVAGSGNDVQLTVAVAASAPVLDFNAGVATFNAAGAVNNTMTLTNNGTLYTLSDSVGAAITLTPAASTAGWVSNGNGSVSGPMGTTTGIVLNLGDGANIVNTLNATANITFSGNGSLTLTGPVTTTGTLAVSEFSSVAVQGNITASTISMNNVDTITGTASGKLIAPTLTLNAATIGSAGSTIRTQAGTILATSGGGGVYLTEDDAASVTVNSAAPGSVSIDNLAGVLTLAGASSTVNGTFALTGIGGLAINGTITTSSGSISLASGGTISTTAAITSTTGNVSLTSQNAIALGGNLNAGSGTIIIAANTDGAGTEGFSQTAGTITTTSAVVPAVSITANLIGGGTGDISLDSTNITGRLTANSNGGSILYAGAAPLSASQQGTQNGGSAPVRTLIAAQYVLTATGAGSIGTDARPIQSSVPATNTLTLSAGDGGIYWTDWASPVTLASATATNSGSIRVVSANADSHNLTVNGPVTTGSGSIYLAADDNFNLNSTVGGPGFSGTVYIAGNRDTGNGTNTLMNTGSSIMTSNSTANAVVLEGFNISGTAAGTITFTQITTGNGGTITLNTNVLAASRGAIQMFDANSFLFAGPNGTIVLDGAAFSPLTNSIGSATLPIAVTAGNVVVNVGNTSAAPGDVFITAAGPSGFTAVNNRNVNFTTTSGLLSISGDTNSVSDGTITLTGAGGIAVNAPLGSATTGDIVLNAGTNNVTVNALLSISTGKTLTTTANGGTKVSTGGILAGIGTANTVNLLSGGTISPADTAIGKLSTGNLTATAGSKFRFDLNGTSNPGVDYDALDVAGTVSLGGATPQVFLGSNYVPTLGDSFTIITSTGAVTGSFAPATFVAANNSAVTFTATVNANSVVLTVSNVVLGPVIDIVGGQLIYNGGGSAIDNNLSVSYAAGNYTFTELNEVITLGPGAVGFFNGSNGNKTFTGNSGTITNAQFTLGAGNDSINILGVNHPVTINGGGQTTDIANIAGTIVPNGSFTVLGVNDITAAPGSLINASTVTLNAINAIGTPTAKVLTKASTIVATAGDGGINIANANSDVAFTGTAGGTGAISVANTTGTLTIAGNTGTQSGTITLASSDTVVVAANVSSALGGTIAINANTDGSGSQGFSQTAGLISTTNNTATALSITVNTLTGDGDLSIDSTAIGDLTGGTITLNANNGDILYAGDTPLSASLQGLTNGGSAPARVISANDFAFTTIGTGSIGTTDRPLQTSAVGTDALTGDVLFDLQAGSGGIFVLKWSGIDGSLNKATTSGAGEIRFVTPNVGGNNLIVTGDLVAQSGNIYLASDDDLQIGSVTPVIVGGAGFSGTVTVLANRDNGTNAQNLKMLANASITTSNTSSNAVFMNIGGDNVAASIITIANISVGNGGGITLNAIPNGAAAENGRIVQEAGTTLNAGALGTVTLITDNNGNTLVDSIGDATNPLTATAGTINFTGNNGNVWLRGSSGANITGTLAAAGDLHLGSTTGAVTVPATIAVPGAAFVDAGTVLVDGTLTTVGGVSVATGATLGGTGTASAVTVTGTITGSTMGGAGKLTAASLTATGTFLADLLGVNVGDQLAVTGNVDITGATLSVNAPNAIPGGTSFKIIDNQGPNPLVGKFTNAPNEGDTITASGQTFTVSYAGEDVTLTRTGSAAPVVSGIVVNGNASVNTQRSRLTTIQVNFASPVDAAQFQTAGAVFLTRVGIPSTNLGTIGTVVNNTNGLVISPASGSVSSITLTFQNINNAGINNASLADGRWELSVVPAGYVANAANTGNQLRRLFGDIDNNGTVDATDFGAFPPFGAQVGSPFDFDNNSDIDGNDFSAFGGRNGYSLA